MPPLSHFLFTDNPLSVMRYAWEKQVANGRAEEFTRFPLGHNPQPEKAIPSLKLKGVNI